MKSTKMTGNGLAKGINLPGKLILTALLVALMAMMHTAVASAPSAEESARLLKNLNSTELKSFDALDLDKLASEDILSDTLTGVPKRFAVPRKVRYTPENTGDWERQGDGSWIWRLRIRGEGAAHLNFGFSRFALPPGAELNIISTDMSSKAGPFTVEDMLPHGQLWTPVVLGQEAMIHLYVPAGARKDMELELTDVNQGYRGFGVKSKACKSGSCNLDVACLSPDDPWNENRRAVGAWTRGGVSTCSGSLVNNTANDRRMLFATATHCGANSDPDVATVVVYWNYESPSCRIPGSPESGAAAAPLPASFSAGLNFVAGTNNPFAGGGTADTRSDWALMELAEPPPDNDFDLFWAGWDRTPPPTTCAAPADSAGTDGLCASIHHPGVDEKRITFVEQSMTLDNIASAIGVHWRARWDPTPPRLPAISPMPSVLPPGVTEPGSSGSALYNADRRLVGVLSGGPAFCGATGSSLSDLYGGLFHAWEGLGTAQTRMRDHLDPLGTGDNFIDGTNSCDAPPAPANLQATATGDNEITLGWNAVANADRYYVYRSVGTCPGSGYVQIGESTVEGFVDDTVSGGTDYVYRVSAVTDANSCESSRSNCSGTQATGVCTAAPAFSGVLTAASAGTPSCAANLTWSPASSRCGNDAQLRYNVYRSGIPDFTPGAESLIASCETGVEFLDQTAPAGNTQFYIVRAEDLGASPVAGQCGGVEETNLLRLDAAAFGPSTVQFFDDVESGPALWSTGGSGAGADFAIVTNLSNSPVSSWFVSDPPAVSDRTLSLAQAVNLAPGSAAVLRFAHRYNTETGFDGGVLEYSIDDGATWQDILAGAGGIPANADRFLANGYVSALSNDFGNPIGGRAAWSGDNAGFELTEVSLQDFAGQALLLRFRAASDVSLAGQGWLIDDISIGQASACIATVTPLILKNGFEPNR